jgi:hypothetical protein
MTLWSHLQVLLDQLKERELREWYLHAAVEYWLEPRRPGASDQEPSLGKGKERKAITDFLRALAPPDSDLAE